MPLYEFECTNCGKIIEDFVKIGTIKIKCSCGGSAKKIMSSSSFILKGNGWAKDGYSKDGNKCSSKNKK